MNVKQEIIRTIEILIDKKIDSSPTDIPTIVLGQSGRKYKVQIDGVERLVPDGINLCPTAGTKVWLRCPNGKIQDAYIAAKR